MKGKNFVRAFKNESKYREPGLTEYSHPGRMKVYINSLNKRGITSSLFKAVMIQQIKYSSCLSVSKK